jgi:hypothetical protein
MSDKPLRAPFPWFGGKSRAASLIWSRIGDVSNYVEPFANEVLHDKMAALLTEYQNASEVKP